MAHVSNRIGCEIINWESQPDGEVEAFFDIQSLKSRLNIQWPQLVKKLSGVESTDQNPWKEV
jgi:hypothetical protein